MKDLIQYVDDLKAKYGSDNKAAKELNIERTTIANIRKRGQMAEETAIKIADALEIDQGEVLIAAAMARSEGAVKHAWENISKRAGLAASVGFMAIYVAPFANSVYNQVCILC
jgi:citrate lyase alpha subunit